MVLVFVDYFLVFSLVGRFCFYMWGKVIKCMLVVVFVFFLRVNDDWVLNVVLLDDMEVVFKVWEVFFLFLKGGIVICGLENEVI